MSCCRTHNPSTALKILSTFLLATISSSPVCQAQFILSNAKVYTVDESNPLAEAIAVGENGIIEAVSSFENVTLEFPEYRVVDLQGQLVLPGFQDVHVHAVEAGINEQICHIPSDAPMEDIPYIVMEECPNGGAFGGAGWIMAAGIDLALLVNSLEENPRAPYPIEVLDAAFPETPVVIVDAYGHGALLNSVAMAEVGYDSLSRDPPGGQILRDADRNPIGIVTENAQHKARDAAFPPSDENKEIAYQGLLKSLEMFAKNGITSISEAGGYWRQPQIEPWNWALQEGKLTARASNSLYVYPDEILRDQIPQLQAIYSNDPDSLLRCNQAKIYVDGILSLGTGLLYEPYLYDPFSAYRQLSTEDENWVGFEYFGDNTTLNFFAQSLVNNGFQLHFHVSGDSAAAIALSAIEFTRNSVTGGSSVELHRLTHNYLIAEKDRPRFARLGVVADFQLSPISLDPSNIEFMSDLIGSERASQLLPALEMYEAGATVTLSSDWDTNELSPLVKMQTVLTRSDGRSFPDLEAVIPLMTLNPAKLLKHDDKTGSIEVGKFADFVVIDKDIFSLSVEEISTARVTRTYLQGKRVFDIEGPPGGMGGYGGEREEDFGSSGVESIDPSVTEKSQATVAFQWTLLLSTLCCSLALLFHY